MFIYTLATHHIFMGVAVARAVIGNLLVWSSLERIFMTNRPARSPFYYPLSGELTVHRGLQRASHLGVVGIEMNVIALVIAGAYAACYPDAGYTSLLVVYLVWLLIMTYAVMIAATRVKRWWNR